jgi:pyruvate dehydrogenase E2 component (dihydrolipoamide acetyltransferase)
VPAAPPSAAAVAQPPAAPAPAAPAAAAARPSTLAVDFSGVFAGPAARRLARELDVDLTTIQGTGEKGRITVADVKVAARVGGAAAGGVGLPDVPTVDFAKFGPIETVPLSRIKRISGPRLHASWVNVPHVTHCDDADITELEAFRKSLDDAANGDKTAPYRVSLLPLLMKASVATLKAFPAFNSALSPAKDSLIYRHYWHIGVAVDTPEGLVVPVLRDVDTKSLWDLAAELADVSSRARAGTLDLGAFSGGCFSVSSLGGIGGMAITPLVNPPEVAVLGVSRAETKPVWRGGEFAPRLIVPLCLSYDHRVIDGAAGARFVVHISRLLSDVQKLIS